MVYESNFRTYKKYIGCYPILGYISYFKSSKGRIIDGMLENKSKEKQAQEKPLRRFEIADLAGKSNSGFIVPYSKRFPLGVGRWLHLEPPL